MLVVTRKIIQATVLGMLVLGLWAPLVRAQDSANVKLVQSLYEAFGKGDIGKIVDASAPDVEWENVGRPQDCACFGKRSGTAGVAEFFKTIGGLWDFKQFTPREFIATGDRVVVLGSYAMVHKTTGKPFEADWTHIFLIKGGKVVSFREFTDTARAAEANKG